MGVTILHTADWQLGKTFGGFPPDVAAILKAERLEAIDRLAAAAVADGIRHVLVAGDVIDSELIDDRGLRAPLTRMAAYAGLVWHLLPGNHDPARPGGVWERLARLGLPANVAAHLTPAAVAIEPDVVLLPAPLAAKHMSTDPTAWMDTAASPEGAIRIGLAHGSVQGFGSLGEAPVPIAPERRERAGLAYLALGDWHGTKQVAEGVWYSGTPEPDSYVDNDPGNALVVAIDGPGARPQVRRVATGRMCWLERRAVVTRLADLGPLEREVAGLGPRARHTLLRLRLDGTMPAAEASELDRRLETWRAALQSLVIERRGLGLSVGAGDVAHLGEPALARIGDRLKALSGAAEPAEARVAARAMQLLLALATAPEDAAAP